MLLEFEKKLADFIRANRLFGSPLVHRMPSGGNPNTAEKVILAVSGGADSMALMYAMHALKSENSFKAELLCAHINHQLRGTNGDLDEEFVVSRAKKLKLAVMTRRIDVRGFARLNKLSIETSARQLRIRALIDIAKANNCNLIATAHQKNDNAETIIQRLSRGTGIRGLAGIWPERVFADEIKFVRPMLCFSRDEIVKYLQQRNLNWHQDHTNADCTYRRNYIRHRLIPALQQDCAGSVAELLSQLAQSAHRFYGVVCSRADELWPDLADCDADKTMLDLKLFLNEPQPVKVELIRRSLINIGCGERYMTQGHYESVLQLAEHNVTGKRIELPGGYSVRLGYGNLIFAKPERDALVNGRTVEPVRLKIPGQTTFENFLIYANVSEKNEVDFKKFKAVKTHSVEWFDLDKTRPPLFVRFRQAGDRFIPLGQNAEKKLGKFLTAQRLPHEIRRDVIVVTDREKIIWVWPIRISEQSKITSQTRKILQLQVTKLNT